MEFNKEDTLILAHLPQTAGSRIILGLAVLFAVYTLSIAIYRLVLSPIAGFPGPKLAALTGWYEFYYDVIKPGKFIFEIERMHKKYGPIVRINPDELSINDGAFYSEVYVAGSVRRTENYNHFAKGIDFEGSHFLTTPHDLHRRRRKPLEPFFSRLGVTRLEPMLFDLVGKLEGRLRALEGSQTVIRLDHAYLAFASDVIHSVCSDEFPDYLSDEKFASHWFDLIHKVIKSIPLSVQFPFLVQFVGFIPEFVLTWAYPTLKSMDKFKKHTRKHIVAAKREKLEPSTRKVETDSRRVTIFRHILNSEMPESELSTDRLTKEAQVLLGAGSVSTARTLDFITFYILSNNNIRSTLQKELAPVMAGYPEKLPSLADLEKLPYLQALIKEGLRLSYGVMHRLPRVSPDAALQYKEWTIPKGVPVGMSAYLMHSDPVVYPKPFEYLPERWLGNIDPKMNRNFVPFSKGSRNCVGMNLAAGEINFVLAALFRPDGPAFDLYKTDESDMIQSHDYLIPLPKLESKGFRVTVH